MPPLDKTLNLRKWVQLFAPHNFGSTTTHVQYTKSAIWTRNSKNECLPISGTHENHFFHLRIPKNDVPHLDLRKSTRTTKYPIKTTTHSTILRPQAFSLRLRLQVRFATREKSFYLSPTTSKQMLHPNFVERRMAKNPPAHPGEMVLWKCLVKFQLLLAFQPLFGAFWRNFGC